MDPGPLWEAYEALEASRVRGGGRRIATDLVSLVRFALEQENELVPVHRDRRRSGSPAG